MRLVCPNCEAKYEVPDDAIPDTGRDVQCTNCGHSWFQMRGRGGAAPVLAPAPVEPTPAAVEPTAEAAPASEPAAEPSPAMPPVAEEPADLAPAFSEAIGEVLTEKAPAEEQAVADTAPDPAPEAVDADPAEVETPASTDAVPAEESKVAVDAISEIAPPLSEDLDLVEAVATSAEIAAEPEPVPVPAVEDEAAVNAAPASDETVGGLAAMPATAEEATSEVVAEASPSPAPGYAVDDSVLAILREEAEREANARRAEALESQTDLGLDTAMPRTAAAAVAAAAIAEAKPAARRDLLPDVEEINSTLRPSEMHDDPDGTPDFVVPPPEAPRGFRSGFLTLMTIAIIATALYVVAPRLKILVPSIAGPLDSYVSMVDSLRLGLDGMMRSATVAISDG